jgi:hypothetical protein
LEIFASQGAPPLSKTPAANFSTIFASVVDTGGKFATGVNDTGDKFATGVNDTDGKLPPVSMTPASTTPASTTPASTTLVSTTPVANLELRLSQRIYEKIRNGPNGIIRGLEEADS